MRVLSKQKLGSKPLEEIKYVDPTEECVKCGHGKLLLFHSDDNPKLASDIIQGAMTFGEEGKEGARVHDLKDVEATLDEFLSHGFTEVRV